MPKKIIQYKCLSCNHIFAAIPGPIQCISCGHFYVQMIYSDCKGPTPCQTPLVCSGGCQYNNDPIHPNRIS